MFEVAKFEPQPEAVRACRRWVTTCLEAQLEPDTLRDVELCVSEVAANAIRHADSTFQVELRLEDGVLRTSVHDDDATGPAALEVEPTSPGGRGLAIVAAVASRWGWTPAPTGGKDVWFEMELPASA